MILDRLDMEPEDFTASTGWAVKPEGACRGDVCVPLPAEARRPDGRIDVSVVAGRLAMPLLADEAAGLWALGPSTATGRALATAEAPELTLPDLSGQPFSLSSLRGQKVVLVAWASW